MATFLKPQYLGWYSVGEKYIGALVWLADIKINRPHRNDVLFSFRYVGDSRRPPYDVLLQIKRHATTFRGKFQRVAFRVKAKATHLCGFCFYCVLQVVYFRPFLPAFFASISFFISKRFGDL